ncbi:MAG: hypothetical protein NC936_05640 [Candidatus Omnitrophica bacterium]|nr:hypothetical protein [Candidatus Omnitrophota bacterium]
MNRGTSQKTEIKKINTLLLGMLSYLSFLCILPILLNKKDKFIVHHAKLGLILFVLEAITVLLGIIPLFGNFVSPFVLGLCFFLSIWGILGVLKNKYSRIILLSDLAQKIDL